MHEHDLGSLKLFHFSTTDARARVLLFHGMGEHSGRHRNTVEFLVAHGVEVVTFDFRGTGRSGGERMWIESFDDYVDDARQVRRWILDRLPPLPLFVLGHSLGGTVALAFAAAPGTAVDGLILSAPGYRPGGGISPLKIRAAKVLSRLTPHLVLRSALDLGALSRDPAVAEAYRSDALCCSFNTVRQGDEILRFCETIPELCKNIHVPTLIVHGANDAIVLLQGSREILHHLASDDKALQVLEGGYHEPHNDIDKEKYFGLLLEWLDAQLLNR